MSWGEATRLVGVLAADPSSALCAALAGWEHPFSREALILADLFDVQYASKAKRRPQPWPRPWNKRRRKWGDRKLTIPALRAVLDANRQPEPPT